MSEVAQTFLDQTLTDLDGNGLKRTLRQLSGSQGRRVTVDGRKVLNFCSNNYLGLADDARLGQAAAESIEKDGFGAGASRLVCGNMTAHQKLEEAIARFKGAESCLVFSTGYMANVGIISSVFGRDDIIFSDRLNHASIVDGIQLSRAQCRRYAHRDMRALEEMLKASGPCRKRGIVTDSVFSMDGDIAPLDEIVALARRYNCLVMIDEAHALGVMGENGRGLAEHFGVESEIDIQMGTLSKAAGSFGAYCCGSKDLTAFLVNKARSFVYTTAMPPSVAAASLRAVEIIETEPDRRARLWENTRAMHRGLKEMGFNTMDSQTPVIPVVLGDASMAVEFSKRLLDAGIFITAIRPPTVPVNTARLRLTVMATHTQSDIDWALGQFQRIGKELCLI